MLFNLQNIPQHWFRPLLVISVGTITLGSVAAFVVADCRPQDGKLSSHSICNSIVGGEGNNELTLAPDASLRGPFFGDGVVGRGGNDTMINYGTTLSSGGATGVNGDMEGDVATGNGGDDVLVNYGTVANDMDGDTALGNGGNDVIINNGQAGDDLDGDNARLNGGDDLIINNGIVGGDIQADDNDDLPTTLGGRDTVVINGLIEGYVDSDAGVGQGGDDHVILQSGANGGSDHELYINGNGGNDTLVFNFSNLDQATYDKLSAEIASGNPALGAITINGQIYDWENFEHLENQLQLKGTDTTTTLADNGHTYAIIEGDKAAVYCVGGRLTVVGMDATGGAEWLFSINKGDLANAMRKATQTKTTVMVAQADGQVLSALGDGMFSMSDGMGRYALKFDGQTCSA